MLKTQDRMAWYTIGEKLSSRHDGEREVYSAVDNEGATVTLTVFNLEADRFAEARQEGREGTDIVEEIRFLKTVKGAKGIPAFLDCGTEKVHGRSYAWMAQEYLDAESLHYRIRNLSALEAPEALEIARQVGRAAEKAAMFTKGGGHYNISTDNILLRSDPDGTPKAYLIGFSNIGESCQGSHPIDTASLDKRFLAPETAKGIFSHRSDIYALGMVTTVMMAGYPDVIETESFTKAYAPDDMDMREVNGADFQRALWKQTGKRTISTPCKRVLQKATDPTAANRFATMGKFIEFLDRIDRGGRKPEAKDTVVEASPQKATQPLGSGSGEPPASGLKSKEQTGSDSHALDAVAGMEEVKNLFRRDFIRIVKNPKVAQAYGIKPSNCTLLYGPQGCGKTFIAEKAAQESGLKYRVVNPSELGSIYVHGAQQKIAELFDEAEKRGPMILIFDEFDALVPKRDAERFHNQSNEVNEMLTQLNNCAARGIYVLATTNRPTLLDPAILRKGRIDRTVYVSLPDREARKELFRLEIEKRPHDAIDYDALADATEGHTCSDIAYIVEETARHCFEETLEQKPETPLPLTTDRLLDLALKTQSSVSETQRKEYLELRDRMESRQGADGRRKVGFA